METESICFSWDKPIYKRCCKGQGFNSWLAFPWSLWIISLFPLASLIYWQVGENYFCFSAIFYQVEQVCAPPWSMEVCAYFHVWLTFPCCLSCTAPSEHGVSQFCVCKSGSPWQNLTWIPEHFLWSNIDQISSFTAFIYLIIQYFLPLFWLGLVSSYLLYHYLIYQ